MIDKLSWVAAYPEILLLTMACVIALVESDPEPVLAAWRAQGLTCFSTHVGAKKESP